jgi:multidrug efflux pump subunit AcrB
MTLSPKLGFTLFPSTDEGVMNIEISARQGTDKDYFVEYLDFIDKKVSEYEEVEVYYTSISDNRLFLSVNLYESSERQEKGQRNIFEIEELITGDLRALESKGLQVNVATLANGPPTGDPV